VLVVSLRNSARSVIRIVAPAIIALMSDVTQILSQIESGAPSAAEQSLPLGYDQLRRAAQLQMDGERTDHTLQTTALVHAKKPDMLTLRRPAGLG